MIPRIVKTNGQLLKEEEAKVRQLLEEAKVGVKNIENLTWQNAQLRMAITAVAQKFNISQAEMKVIYDEYCAKQDEYIIKCTEEMKNKYMEDLRAGRVPDIKIQMPENGDGKKD